MKLPKRVTEFLYRAAVQRVAGRRKPDIVIGQGYLRRWYIIPRNRFFNIYLHQFVGSDDDRALHDHPWWSCSIILHTGYWEIRPYDGIENVIDYTAYMIQEGQVVFRKPTDAHRVQLFQLPDGEMPAWTLFITGPRVREWGFHCPNGWKDWRDFTNYRNGDQTQIGPGCDP